MNKLSAAKVPALLKKKGQWGDGAGLWLIGATPAAASWVFRYTVARKAKVMGLGSAHSIELAEARTKAAAARELLDAGIDPQAQQVAAEEQTERVVKEANETKATMTFRACAEAYIKAHRPGWKNDKHAEQWPTSLETFVYPSIGALDVGAVETKHITSIIEPMWTTKVETANRVRGRIEAVLSWATAREFRQGDNPARWRGHFENLLPPRSKIRRVKHHASMPYERVGDFLRELQGGSIGARALEFLILCASRTGEVRGATWGEFDLTAGVWTLPGERMKAGVMHRIPLSGRALEILVGQKRLTGGVGFVFPGQRSKQPLSAQALLGVMERMKKDEFTPHGFRTSFRTWCSEKTTFPSAVAERALAHTNRDKVEAAYERTDLFKRRRALMATWAAYLTSPLAMGTWAKFIVEDEDDAEVVPIRPAAAA